MFWPDVTELKAFYDSPLGQMCTHCIRRAVASLWPEAKGETLLGIGYALPTLRPFLKSADVVAAAMPSGQGVIHWPAGQAALTLLSHETAQPFRSGTLNRLILMHALEHAQPVSLILQEAERLLTPSGRMLVILPNRRSLWAGSEQTPYAQGQPYSMAQVKRLLEKHGFSVLQTRQALFFLPSHSRGLLRFARWLERLGESFFPHFGGILLVEVEKRTPGKISGTPVKVFASAPQTAASLNRKSL